MATPVATAVRNTYPDSFIAWAIDSRWQAVVDTERLVDLRYAVPRQTWKETRASWTSQFRHFARLRRFQFDVGIDLQGHSKTAICLRIAKPKRCLAVCANDLLAKITIPVADLKGAECHTVERNLHALTQLLDCKPTRQAIMPGPVALPREVGIATQGRLATISISAGYPKKAYPADRWTEVARGLSERGFSVAFLGGPDDVGFEMPGVHNWIGKLPLDQTLTVVAKSSLHLAADTGTGHMAAAYGVPLVSIFGYTDKARYRPYTENAVVLDAGPSMRGVSPEQVLAAAEGLFVRQRYAFPH
jgi:ADP-heptose:LPS heptosyltransferase